MSDPSLVPSVDFRGLARGLQPRARDGRATFNGNCSRPEFNSSGNEALKTLRLRSSTSYGRGAGLRIGYSAGDGDSDVAAVALRRPNHHFVPAVSSS